MDLMPPARAWESRQADILNEQAAGLLSVAVIGLGTAGSWTVPLLLKLGIGSLEVWDADAVGHENVSSQLYGSAAAGSPKADALAVLMEHMTNLGRPGRFVTHNRKFTGRVKGKPPTVVISCVDSWAGRRAALAWAQGGSRLFIEARMVGRLGVVHAINPAEREEVNWLENTFGADGKGPVIPCGMRGTAFLGAYIGAEIAALVANLANDEAIPREMAYSLGLHQTISMD